MTDLYADGGVIGRNPSTEGGTWAWCEVNNGEFVRGFHGVVTPASVGMFKKEITNNITEMLAVLYALQAQPADWCGTVYSDSAVTLGRLRDGWQWKNIPPWMIELYRAQTMRLKNWKQIKFVLVQGHPTRDELAAGVGKSGTIVSEWNKWCDLSCRDAAAEFKRK